MVITLSIPIKTQQHRSTKRNREMKKKKHKQKNTSDSTHFTMDDETQQNIFM